MVKVGQLFENNEPTTHQENVLLMKPSFIRGSLGNICDYVAIADVSNNITDEQLTRLFSLMKVPTLDPLWFRADRGEIDPDDIIIQRTMAEYLEDLSSTEDDFGD